MCQTFSQHWQTWYKNVFVHLDLLKAFGKFLSPPQLTTKIDSKPRFSFQKTQNNFLLQNPNIMHWKDPVPNWALHLIWSYFASSIWQQCKNSICNIVDCIPTWFCKWYSGKRDILHRLKLRLNRFATMYIRTCSDGLYENNFIWIINDKYYFFASLQFSLFAFYIFYFFNQWLKT